MSQAGDWSRATQISTLPCSLCIVIVVFKYFARVGWFNQHNAHLWAAPHVACCATFASQWMFVPVCLVGPHLLLLPWHQKIISSFWNRLFQVFFTMCYKMNRTQHAVSTWWAASANMCLPTVDQCRWSTMDFTLLPRSRDLSSLDFFVCGIF